MHFKCLKRANANKWALFSAINYFAVSTRKGSWIDVKALQSLLGVQTLNWVRKSTIENKWRQTNKQIRRLIKDIAIKKSLLSFVETWKETEPSIRLNFQQSHSILLKLLENDLNEIKISMENYFSLYKRKNIFH